jgi:Fe2+ or Zn2+ uptake regulation protein
MLSPQSRNKWSLGWTALTDIQRATLRLVFNGQAPTSAASRSAVAMEVQQAKVAGSTIARALESLAASHLIERDSNSRTFRVADPVMRAWLTVNKSSITNDATADRARFKT